MTGSAILTPRSSVTDISRPWPALAAQAASPCDAGRRRCSRAIHPKGKRSMRTMMASLNVAWPYAQEMDAPRSRRCRVAA